MTRNSSRQHNLPPRFRAIFPGISVHDRSVVILAVQDSQNREEKIEDVEV